jgi:hypothetical protein
LNCQKPVNVSEAEWRRALDDGGLFLDARGSDAAKAPPNNYRFSSDFSAQ